MYCRSIEFNLLFVTNYRYGFPQSSAWSCTSHQAKPNEDYVERVTRYTGRVDLKRQLAVQVRKNECFGS